MTQVSLSKVTINFHPVAANDLYSVLVWMVAAPFGRVSNKLVHTSLSLRLEDNIEYTYDITTKGVFVQRELPTPTAKFTLSVPSYLPITERLKESIDEEYALETCELVKNLFGRQDPDSWTCAGWVYWVVYGDNVEKHINIGTLELYRRLLLETQLGGEYNVK